MKQYLVTPQDIRNALEELGYKEIEIKLERKTLTITIITKDEVSEVDQLEIRTRVSGEICVEFVREVNING